MRERIEELRDENAHGPYAGYGVTVEEMDELLDAALAVSLLQEAKDADAARHGVPAPRGWVYDVGLTDVFCGPLTERTYPHSTIQAAILAALRREVR